MASSKRRTAQKYGFRSGLELAIAQELSLDTRPFLYEKVKIEWEDLAYRTYTPDFVLHNNIIIETKGRFVTADRRKHLFIQWQHPTLDIRFVFTKSSAKLSKGAKSTYAEWCDKHGFLYSDTTIPSEWLDEPSKEIDLILKKEVVSSFIPFPEEKKKKLWQR